MFFKKRISKIIPSFFTIKEGSTFLTKPLFPQEREDVTALSAIFAPPVPPQREGPYPIPKPQIPNIGIRDVTALRCSEPLRYKVGGPSKVFAILCGMGPPCYKLTQLDYSMPLYHFSDIRDFIEYGITNFIIW